MAFPKLTAALLEEAIIDAFRYAQDPDTPALLQEHAGDAQKWLDGCVPGSAPPQAALQALSVWLQERDRGTASVLNVAARASIDGMTAEWEFRDPILLIPNPHSGWMGWAVSYRGQVMQVGHERPSVDESDPIYKGWNALKLAGKL